MSVTKHVAVRLDPEVLARVDALIPSLSRPWRKARRSDVLRALVLAALPTFEPPPTKPARKRGAR